MPKTIADLTELPVADVADDSAVYVGVDSVTLAASRKMTLAGLKQSASVNRFATVSAMSSASYVRDGDVAITRGYTSVGVGAGVYRFVSGDTTTADGGFVVTHASGRWHLLDKTVANVYQFGAVGDGVTLDTTKIQAAVNTGVPVYFPAGVFLIDDAIEFGANCVLFGESPGRSEVKWSAAAASQVMFKNSATVVTLQVRNMRFRHRADATAGWSDGGAFLTNSGKTIVVDNCDFVDMSTTALEFLGTDDAVTREDVTVTNCRAWCEAASFYTGNFCKPGGGRTFIFRGNHVRQCARGVSLEQKNNRNFYEVIITDNVFVDSKVANKSSTQTAAPIHLSLETGTQTIESVVISNNIIRSTDGINGTTSAGYGIALTCSANTIKRAVVANNIIDTWSGRSSSSIPILCKGVEYPIVTGNIVSDVTWSSTSYRGMMIQTYTYGIVRDNLFKGTTYSAPIVLSGNVANCEMEGNFCQGVEVQHNQAPGTTWVTLTPAVANPDVSGVRMGKVTDTGANTITSLNNGTNQQVLRLWIANNNTTLQNNASIKLTGSANYTPGANGAMLTLYCDDGTWRELSRVAY